MKLSYYDKFKCIANECEITCCQEWKISVDEETKKKWNEQQLGCNICKKDGDNVIKLNEEKRCPFLTKDELCGIVIDKGVDMIPHTCDVFPRQIHEFENRTEYALVSCCPEVIRLLDSEKIEEVIKPLFEEEYDEMYSIRNMVINIIAEAKDSTLGLLKAFYILLDIRDESKVPDYNKEFLSDLDEALEKIERNERDTFTERNELFLDIVYNYRKQGIYSKFLDDISLVADDISENYSEELLSEYEEFQRNMFEYDKLFKKYLISELFADGILSDSDLYEFTIMLQWIAMEYVLIRHAIFLNKKILNRKVSFTDISQYMVIISRIMGYSQEDIHEYMEECFMNPMWDFGYMALIVGKGR